MDNLLNLLFVPSCLVCGTRGAVLCTECLERCSFIDERASRCIVCDKASSGGVTHPNCFVEGVPSRLISLFEYEGVVRDCIKRSKYGKKEFMALKVLVRRGLKSWLLVRNATFDHTGVFEDLVVIPIPSSRSRLKQRGFNQAEVISREVARFFGLKVDTRLLRRTVDTQAQFGKSRKERFTNLKGAFCVGGEGFGGANAGFLGGGVRPLGGESMVTLRNIPSKVLLVDDVCTTGATLLEASNMLYAASVQEVVCLTLSKKF